MTDTLEILKQVVSSSAELSGWAIAILGGSVATIVSTSYRRPRRFRLRLSYLLFLPAWCAIGYSIYSGDLLARKYLAALQVKPDLVVKIAEQVNDVYGYQRFYLLLSLTLFGCWLVIYLLSWVFAEIFMEDDK